MFCSGCGTQLSEGSVKCTNCGASLNEFNISAAISSAAQSGAIKGFFILSASFFMMPLKTLRLTVQQLRAIGNQGALDVESTDVPHLSWLKTAGNVVASIVVVICVASGIGMGLASLGDFRYSAGSAIGGLIGYPIGSLLLAIAADWLIMFWLELMQLWVNIANDIKHMRR
ncbi:MAG: zinc ribbon domain-containing protein [Sulfuritalea sp.]|nr:zinc ribbon domain-containing protein [Sulfuritalea sp.]